MSLDKEISAINKQYGKGTIMRLGSDPIPIDRLPLGIYSLDRILGGGLPKGRIIEVYGFEASGKSSLCLHAIIAAQKLNLECAFIDVEHSLDVEYAQRTGIDTKKLLLSQPSCGEEALDIVDALINTGGIAVIVVDSVSALVPRTELEGESGDAHMGLQARLMSQAMRKLTGATAKTNTILIFTNQIRMKFTSYGAPTTTSGGNALKFYSSVRLKTKAIGKVEQDKKIIGNRVRIECVKNKTAPPYKKCEVDLIYGIGFDYRRDLFDIAVKQSVIEERGKGWFYYGDKKFHGRDNALEQLNFNELQEKIK